MTRKLGVAIGIVFLLGATAAMAKEDEPPKAEAPAAACQKAMRDQQTFCRARAAGRRPGARGPARSFEGPGSYNCLAARMRVDEKCYQNRRQAKDLNL